MKRQLYTGLFYVLAVVGDYISTKLVDHAHIPGLGETNPFVRDEGMHFVLHKAMVLDALLATILVLTGVVVYHAVRKYNDALAVALGLAMPIYLAYDRLVTAVLPNLLYSFHFYVGHDDAASIIQKLLGGN